MPNTGKLPICGIIIKTSFSFEGMFGIIVALIIAIVVDKRFYLVI